MGIDYGKKRIGIALSDPLGFAAHPFEVISRKTLKSDLARISAIAKENGVSLIVIGLPLNMDGTPGMLADEVNHFTEKVKMETTLPVELYDERMTTLQAERILVEEADASRDKRKKVRDKVAAALILQSYLQKSHGN